MGAHHVDQRDHLARCRHTIRALLRVVGPGSSVCGATVDGALDRVVLRRQTQARRSQSRGARAGAMAQGAALLYLFRPGEPRVARLRPGRTIETAAHVPAT
jgi:hypothetical protein